MPQRFLRPGLTTSQRFNSVDWISQSFYVRLLTLVDDYGRYEAHPLLLRGHACAMRPDVTVDMVEQICDDLSKAGLVTFYEVEDKLYLQIWNWQERARSASKYPAPDGTNARPKGNIYFVLSEKSHRIKIGYTAYKAESRIATLQIGSAEPLTLLDSFEGSPQDERDLHRKLSIHRLAGEWFKDCEDVRNCLQQKTNRCEMLLPSPSSSPSSSPSIRRHSTNGSAQQNTSAPADLEKAWRETIAADPAYSHIRVSDEFGKMLRWCEVNKKQPTRRRFIYWLNRIEKPFKAFPGIRKSGAAKQAGPLTTTEYSDSPAKSAERQRLMREVSDKLSQQMSTTEVGGQM